MKFELTQSIAILERTPTVLRTLLEGLPEDWTANNEGENTWSPFDVLGHLIHGEDTDWIPRAQIILSDAADKSFEPFDRFAQEEKSKGKSVSDLLDEFEKKRAENIATLKAFQLTEEDLNKKGNHPDFGEVTLSQLLSTWTVHDLAHLNQISRVMAKQYKGEVGSWLKYINLLNR